MPEPHVALRQDRHQPLRYRRDQRVGSDANAGEQAYEKCNGDGPMQQYRAYVASRRTTGARSVIRRTEFRHRTGQFPSLTVDLDIHFFNAAVTVSPGKYIAAQTDALRS